jgi:hypothetical protein
MPNFQPTLFPTIDETMQLVRSIINDTFSGIAGAQGRIFTNDAPFTLPYLNSAIRKVLRTLRNEGVTFPIKDGIVLRNIPPVVQADPSVFISVGFTGTNNGTTTSATPYLPGDCMQVYVVRQRLTGSNLQFTIMPQSQEGLPSGYQNNWLGLWEWRQYAIWMNGSLQARDIMIRYQSGQPPLNTPAADFATTPIYIIDSQDALANLMAANYARARGGKPEAIKSCEDEAAEAIDEMALEYIRRAQTVNYSRDPYQGGGSNSESNSGLGSTGTA